MGRKFEFRRQCGPYVIWKIGEKNTSYIAELDGSQYTRAITNSRLVLYHQRKEGSKVASFGETKSKSVQHSPLFGGICDAFSRFRAEILKGYGMDGRKWD
ncbi:hypothetical protein HK096_001454, partial [Nowakowskiella sp. JEL0078]